MKPDVEHLNVFGNMPLLYIPKQFRKKIDAKSKNVLMVGYQDDSSNYRFFYPVSKKFVVYRDVIFAEYCGVVKHVVDEEFDELILSKNSFEQDREVELEADQTLESA